MTLEVQRVSESGFGSLQSCLVEGDPQSEKRARRIKQRALFISIALQALALTALLLYPLLSKGERISFRYATLIPPYRHGSPAPAKPGPRQAHPRPEASCRFFPPMHIPPGIPRPEPAPAVGDNSNFIPGVPEGPTGDPDGNPFREEIISPNHGPARPAEEQPNTVPRKVSELLQMAQLINRVEPVYPRLAIKIQREGRVELHTIIGTDGTIQSLEVVSGDPLFIQSALSAVREWRYRPTILNGRAVEVDTHITVIYTLSH